MSFSQQPSKANKKLTSQEEIQLAYLLPSYETYRSRLIRYLELSAVISSLIERHQITFSLMSAIIQQQEKEIYRIDLAIKLEKEELDRQRTMLAQIDQEKSQLLNRIIKYAEEVDILRSQLEIHLDKLNQAIKQIDIYLKLLQADTDKRYKQLYQLVDKQFSSLHIDTKYQLAFNKESNEFVDINVNDILQQIKQLKLDKISNRAQSIEVNHTEIVEQEVKNAYRNQFYAKERNQMEINHFDTSMAKFLADNESSLLAIKSEINIKIEKSGINQKTTTLLDRIKQNDENCQDLIERKSNLQKEKDSIETIIEKNIDQVQDKFSALIKQVDKIDLSHLQTEEMQQVIGNLEEAKKLSVSGLVNSNDVIKDFEIDLADIDSYLKDSPDNSISSKTESTSETLPNSPTSNSPSNDTSFGDSNLTSTNNEKSKEPEEEVRSRMRP